jgi:hypothetical protein
MLYECEIFQHHCGIKYLDYMSVWDMLVLKQCVRPVPKEGHGAIRE